jgi:hypothetical protein
MGKRTRAPAVRERPGSMIVLGTRCTCVPLALRLLVYIIIYCCTYWLLFYLYVSMYMYTYIYTLLRAGIYAVWRDLIYSGHRIVRGTAEHS